MFWLVLSITLECRAYFFRLKASPRIKTWQCRLESCVPLIVVGDNDRDDTAVEPRISLIHLPIFPLRKFPRLPTDSLTLNLYEDRYLQMSKDTILPLLSRSKTPSFGAVYVADLPQVVPRGCGPVTPILQSGLVGTLFFVEDTQQATLSTQGEALRRQRIRLDARGVARFRIDSIVSDGTGAYSRGGDDVNNVRNLPYLVVNATLVFDEVSDEESVDEEMFVVDRPQEKKSILMQRNPLIGPDDKDLLDFEMRYEAILRLGSSEPWYSNSIALRNEMLSFFLASRITAQEQPKETVTLLQLTDTEERVQVLKRIYRRTELL